MPVRGADDLDVVVTKQFVDAHLLGFIVFHDKQTPASRLREVFDLRERVGNAFACRRLGDERERAARKSVLAIFVERHDLHGYMARERVLFELTEHVPSQHVGQEDVERDRSRLILLGQIERVIAADRQQNLEALVARQIEKDPCIMRIVLDDEQDAVARLDFQPIVRESAPPRARPIQQVPEQRLWPPDAAPCSNRHT